MDGDIALVVPWTSGLNLVAMALLGVAWLTLVVGLRWRWRTRTVAALPSLATLAVAVAGAPTIGDPKPFEYSPPLMGLVGFFELLAVVALVWILVCQPEARGRHIAPRLVVVLSGTTAFGFVHVITEYFTMVSFGGGNGDMPIGYGYLIFATITISAILTVIMTLLVRQKVAEAEPRQDHGSRPYDAGDVARSPVADGVRVPSMPKQLIIGALVQVVSISLGVCLGYLAFLSVFSILDR
jgi:peptidoglycan/LPS O-acetylase OafA/YrhL